MLEQARSETDGAGGAEPAGISWTRGDTESAGLLAQEQGSAIHSDQFAQEQKKLLEHGLGIQGVRENSGKIAEKPQGLRRGRGSDGLRGSGEFQDGRWYRLGWRDAVRGGRPESFEKGREQAWTNGFSKDVCDALQIGFFFPVPFLPAGKDEDRTFRSTEAELLDGPESLNISLFDIEDAGIDQTMGEERLSFLQTGTMNDPALLRYNARPHCFCKIGMLGQNQQGLHVTIIPDPGRSARS